jgi:hypothetical protein
MTEKWKKMKTAVYLRRSKGETGTTSDQLNELLPQITKLEKQGKIRKIDRTIQGRDIKKQRRGVEYFPKGDIYNEGDGFSGFSVKERPVFMELLDRLRKGQYDAVIAVSMDRFARNYGALSRYAYDLWGEQEPPKRLYGLAERLGLGELGYDGAIQEKVLSSLMDWGGLAKELEILKAEKKRTGTNIDKGYLLGSKPEFVGKVYRGKTSKGVRYRDAWEMIQNGENSNKIARAAGKYAKDGSPERSWVRTWKPRLLAYDELGVLNDWLDAYEAVDNYIKEFGQYPASSYKSQEVTNLLKHTAGYFAYPAGVLLVNPTTKEREFIVFPKPLDVGIERLASVTDPLELDDFEVEREEYDGRDLAKYQTQPRAGKGGK